MELNFAGLQQEIMASFAREQAPTERMRAYKGQKPKPSMKRSRQQLQQDFTLSGYEAKLARNLMAFQQQVQESASDQYPPCTLPLSKLAPITLGDLLLDTHHRGRVLIVKTFGVAYRIRYIQNAVEDQLGDVDRVEVYGFLPTSKPARVLPTGAIIAIKEPFYDLDADDRSVIRVDHPSDLIILKPDDKIIPEKLRPRARNTTAIYLKNEGNAEFKKGAWQQAADIYSDALSLEHDDDDLRRTLHRNRAAAHLNLGRYELAITDAKIAMIPAEDTSDFAKQANLKALYRAGRASYEMGDFLQAKGHFDQSLQLDATNKEAQEELARVKHRLKEQDMGDYEFSAMAKAARTSCYLDHASFVNKTTVGPAGNCGRGLFSTKDIQHGEVVMVEKAFHAVFPSDKNYEELATIIKLEGDTRIGAGPDEMMHNGILEKLLYNPRQANTYLSLCSGITRNDTPKATMLDGKVTVDSFLVQSIIEHNASNYTHNTFSGTATFSPHDKRDYRNKGIWLRQSYANHSCLPNASFGFLGDMMIVRAVRDTCVGEEITISYMAAGQPLGMRREMMQDYDFECDCVLCQAETEMSQDEVLRQERLREDVLGFIDRVRGDQGFSAAQMKEGTRLLEEMRSSYPSTFRRLPRLDCVRLGLLVGSNEQQIGPKRGFEALLEVCRDAGYFIPKIDISATDETTTSNNAATDSETATTGDEAGNNLTGNNEMEFSLTVDRVHASPAWEAAYAAFFAGNYLSQRGYRDAGDALRALSREVYMALHGVDEGYEGAFAYPDANGKQ